MLITLKEVLDELFANTKFNKQLAKLAYEFQIQFINRSDDHMKFFGGNLIGVYRIRFTEPDIARYYDEVIDKDMDVVRKAIRTVTTINHEFKISSDPTNLVWIYMIHRFLTTPYLDPAKKERAAMDVALVFNYRTIAALLATYFKYPTDTDTAQAVYERLSGRYLIKKLGTWQKVFQYRAEEFISKESIHYQAIINFTDDAAIVNAVNDMQSRTKDTLKNIYAEFIKVKEEGVKINSSSSTMIDADGDEIVKDRIHGLETYSNYILDVMIHQDSFIRTELVDVVTSVISTVPEKPFVHLLRWMSDEISKSNRDMIVKFTEVSLMLAFNYLLKHSYVVHHSKDMLFLVSKLKGYILSSRESEGELDAFREQGDTLVKKATEKTNSQAISSLRNGLFLYICIRAFTKHAYTH